MSILKINIQSRCCILNTLHELIPKSASQWPTQKLYENCFLFQKECSRSYDFYWEANKIGWINCAHIIHVEAMTFCTCNQIMFIINNIKEGFQLN